MEPRKHWLDTMLAIGISGIGWLLTHWQAALGTVAVFVGIYASMCAASASRKTSRLRELEIEALERKTRHRHHS